MKFASLFTGMGGADIGAMQAGLTPIWGVEIDPDIATIFNVNQNGDYVADSEYLFCDNVLNFVDYCGDIDRPDWLHASPPCINASRAKNGKETQEDIQLADAICRAIETLKPDYFSLENVDGYLYFDSFHNIKQLLYDQGYNVDVQILNCSSYGVSQSRRRLFLLAGKRGLFHGFPVIKTSPTVSWYEAIADLIPTLKKTTLTDWQCQAIKAKYKYALPCHWGCEPHTENFVIQRSGARKKDGIPNNTIRMANEPMFTVKAMSGKVRVSPKQATIVIDGQPYEADTRCLARWQSIPDWYQFSGDLKLDTKMIGNAVPPLMMQKIIESVLQ